MRIPSEILLVEDNEEDVFLTRKVFGQCSVLSKLRVVKNGVEAMAYLRQEGAYACEQRPALVLMDLNLPLKTGQETLEEIKSDPVLKSIPVIILTTSGSGQDIRKAYAANANCYIVKPVRLEDFQNIVCKLEEFWLQTVSLPAGQADISGENS